MSLEKIANISDTNTSTNVQDNIIVEKNGLTPPIYELVRGRIDMEPYHSDDVAEALKNTLFSVVVWENDQPIGIGRVVGDGRIVFFIKDVAVIPEKQRMGIGTIVMDNLMGYIKEVGASNAYVGLMSLRGKEAFYEKYGFHTRPYKHEGSGMTKYLNRDNF